jgi:hypothetical protein
MDTPVRHLSHGPPALLAPIKWEPLHGVQVDQFSEGGDAGKGRGGKNEPVGWAGFLRFQRGQERRKRGARDILKGGM